MILNVKIIKLLLLVPAIVCSIHSYSRDSQKDKAWAGNIIPNPEFDEYRDPDPEDSIPPGYSGNPIM